MTLDFRGDWSRCALVLLAGTLIGLSCHRSEGAISGITRVASGLNSPIFATHAPGDRERLFIAERGGAIRVLNLTTGNLEPTPFLTIPNVDTFFEGGFLGMTFHPDYPTNGKFYVNVNIDNGGQNFQGAISPFSTHIREYTVSANPNVANPTPREILSFLQPQGNHNAGWIGFSPLNGYLYIPTGDGGGGNDRDSDGDNDGHTPPSATEFGGNAQDITGNLLGKILRIDVNGDDFPADANRNYRIVDSNPYADIRNAMREVTTAVPGDDEIFSRGLRNPFRDSFDRLTGDLWLGDVGQGAWEEINKLSADALGGENFGWRGHEGVVLSSPFANYLNPEYAYDRDNDPFGGSVVSGGYVYRGPDPSLQGKYFFLDSRNSTSLADDNYWMFDIDDPTGTVENIDSMLTPNVESRGFPVSYGEDAVGNLYIVHLSGGSVYRINTTELIAGDYDGDGDVDGADYLVWKNKYGTADNRADGNKDGTVNVADYTVWRNNLGNTAQAMGGNGAGNETVPEPASAALLLPIFALFAAGRAFRPRRGKV
jgi:hypothetical protein